MQAGFVTDGAAKGVIALNKGLNQAGVESKVLLSQLIKQPVDNVISASGTKKKYVFQLVREQLDILPLRKYPNREKLLFSQGKFGINLRKHPLYEWADIIHLHWINRAFIRIDELRKINKPIVWTMRDMWTFTGGCHISMGCNKYTTGCGNCPILKSKKTNDLSRKIVQKKHRLYPSIYFTAISNWLASCAENSLILKDQKVVKVSNNVDSSEFFPLDKNYCRECLGISTNKSIILTGAQSANDPYKGFKQFIESLAFLDREKYFLLFFGNLNTSLVEDLGFEYKSLGFLFDSISMRIAYSSSDVFVAPSLFDSFGKTLAEAMACEIPVVCFDATGPKDIVDHMKNGYKAKPYQPEDLANGIRTIVEDLNLAKRLGNDGRSKVLKQFDIHTIAKEFINVYKQLLT